MMKLYFLKTEPKIQSQMAFLTSRVQHLYTSIDVAVCRTKADCCCWAHDVILEELVLVNDEMINLH